MESNEENTVARNARVLTVGIAGYGVVGERRRKVIDEHPNLRLVAVADLKFDDDKPRDFAPTQPGQR